VTTLDVKGWAIVVGTGKRQHFAADPMGHYPIDGQFNPAFYGSRASANHVIKTMKRVMPKYARTAKVVAVAIEMREVASAKGKERKKK
jgi:hypothetical protein